MFDPLAPILMFLITAGVKDFAVRVLNRPFGSTESAVIAAFVGAFILFANSLGTLLPAEHLPFVSQLVTLIVTVASGFGIHATAKMIKGW